MKPVSHYVAAGGSVQGDHCEQAVPQGQAHGELPGDCSKDRGDA